MSDSLPHVLSSTHSLKTPSSRGDTHLEGLTVRGTKMQKQTSPAGRLSEGLFTGDAAGAVGETAGSWRSREQPQGRDLWSCRDSGGGTQGRDGHVGEGTRRAERKSMSQHLINLSPARKTRRGRPSILFPSSSGIH